MRNLLALTCSCLWSAAGIAGAARMRLANLMAVVVMCVQWSDTNRLGPDC